MHKEIPKIIHYCWFGGKPLSPMAIKCIESWKKFFPDYKIIQWNESNFDINQCQYIQDAYKEKKWAHVSDFARLAILYEYGGIYFDTDVEVVKSFDEILKNGSFCGFEREGSNVALGLGFGVEKNNSVIKEILDSYVASSFYTDQGKMDCYNTIVVRTTRILSKYGLLNEDIIQNINGINIYPKEYFNPMCYETGELNITDNTYSIHWYEGTWLPKSDLHIHQMEQKIRQKYPKYANILCFFYRKGYRLKDLLFKGSEK